MGYGVLWGVISSYTFICIICIVLCFWNNIISIFKRMHNVGMKLVNMFILQSILETSTIPNAINIYFSTTSSLMMPLFGTRKYLLQHASLQPNCGVHSITCKIHECCYKNISVDEMACKY